MIQFVMETKSIEGPVNFVSPEPVTNAQFARNLGKTLGRPSVMPLPGFMARLLLGEMADAMLLTSIRAVPLKLQQAGYAFRYPKLDQALDTLLV